MTRQPGMVTGGASARYWLAWCSAGLAVGLLLAGSWWFVLTDPFNTEDRASELVIPAGTAAALESNQPFVFAPERFSVPTGGRLRVVNEDVVAHTVGSTSIPPGATADVEATESGELFCTVHESGHIEVELGSRPPVTGVVALVLGCGAAALVTGWTLRTGR